MLTSTRPARPRVAAAPRARSSNHSRASTPSVLYPLDFVYARAGVEVPTVKVVQPNEIPSPYHSLLVHQNDMTVTLERHFGGRVVLRPLSTFSSGVSYFRRVLLAQEYSGRPVEMGAIRIRLDAFSPRIRTQIRQNEIPLGRILRDGGVDFKSVAKVFLAITPNPEMMGVFWMREPRTLYGRQTEVMYRGAKIGDIVEVLPLV
jgi:chorismate-pyruvate lyase